MESKKSDVKEALGSSSLLRNILVVLMTAIFLSIVAYSWMFPSVSSDPTEARFRVKSCALTSLSIMTCLTARLDPKIPVSVNA